MSELPLLFLFNTQKNLFELGHSLYNGPNSRQQTLVNTFHVLLAKFSNLIAAEPAPLYQAAAAAAAGATVLPADGQSGFLCHMFT